jgi:hypothetical protein
MEILERFMGFRVTKKEQAVIKAAAKRNGVHLSRWLREITVDAASKGAHVGVVYDEPTKR